MSKDSQHLIPSINVAQLREKSKAVTSLLKAIANENRLMILCHLIGQEMSVSELNERLDLSQSALSQHLAVLRRDRLVQTRRESQTIYYSLHGDKAMHLISTLHRLYS